MLHNTELNLKWRGVKFVLVELRYVLSTLFMTFLHYLDKGNIQTTCFMSFCVARNHISQRSNFSKIDTISVYNFHLCVDIVFKKDWRFSLEGAFSRDVLSKVLWPFFNTFIRVQEFYFFARSFHCKKKMYKQTITNWYHWYHVFFLFFFLLGRQKKKETCNLVLEEVGEPSFISTCVHGSTWFQIQLLLEVRENQSTAGWQYHLQSAHRVQGDDQPCKVSVHPALVSCFVCHLLHD